MAGINTPSKIVRRIIKKLKLCRKKAGLTQVQLALKAGLSTDYISKIEQGKNFPSIKVLCKIADVMKIDPHEFLKP